MTNKHVRNDYIFSIINKLVMFVSSFLTAAMINKFLGPELKGEYAYIVNLTNLFAIFGNLGIYQSYPKFYKDNVENVKHIYCNIVFIQFIIYLIIVAIVGLFSNNLVIFIAALIVPTQTLANQLSMIVMIEKISFRQVVQISTMILKTLLMLLLMLLLPKKLIFVLYLLLIINVIQILLYFYNLKFKFNLNLINKNILKKIGSFGFYASISQLLLNINYKADIIMSKFFVDYYNIGLYSVGVSIAECIWLIPDAFKEVLFSRTARNNPIKEINLAIKINMLISLIVLIIVFVFSKEIITVYSNEEYINATIVTKVLMIGVPFMALFKITNPLYLSNGKQKQYCFFLMISAIINIILNLLLIPSFGILGAAIATIIAFAICGLLFYINYIREYNINWYEPLIFRKNDIKQLLGIFHNDLHERR